MLGHTRWCLWLWFPRFELYNFCILYTSPVPVDFVLGFLYSFDIIVMAGVGGFCVMLPFYFLSGEGSLFCVLEKPGGDL